MERDLGGIMESKPIIINVKINDRNDIYDKYNDNILSKELSNYIYDQCRGEKLNKKININIISNINFNEEEENNIKSLIKNNYSLIRCDNLIQFDYNNKKSLIGFLIGILFIITASILENNSLFVLSEILSIFGWVSIWEVAYHIIFIDAKKSLNNKRTIQLEKAKINFMENR